MRRGSNRADGTEEPQRQAAQRLRAALLEPNLSEDDEESNRLGSIVVQSPNG
jgi:hypothetical protein